MADGLLPDFRFRTVSRGAWKMGCRGDAICATLIEINLAYAKLCNGQAASLDAFCPNNWGQRGSTFVPMSGHCIFCKNRTFENAELSFIPKTDGP